MSKVAAPSPSSPGTPIGHQSSELSTWTKLGLGGRLVGNLAPSLIAASCLLLTERLPYTEKMLTPSLRIVLVTSMAIGALTGLLMQPHYVQPQRAVRPIFFLVGMTMGMTFGVGLLMGLTCGLLVFINEALGARARFIHQEQVRKVRS